MSKKIKKIKKQKAQQARLLKIKKDPQEEKIIKIKETQELGSCIDPEIDKAATAIANKAVAGEGIGIDHADYHKIHFKAYADYVCSLPPAP